MNMSRIKNIIKKASAIVLSVSMLLSFVSCSSNRHPFNPARREAKKIFEYIKNKDTKKLNRLFSEDVRDSHDLDDEWDDFFDIIDGDIVSYGKISSGGEEVYIDYGKVTYSYIIVNINDVKTDTGMTYDMISYCQARVNKKHPGNEGIGLFSIQLPSDNDRGFEEVTVGEVIIYYD